MSPPPSSADTSVQRLYEALMKVLGDPMADSFEAAVLAHRHRILELAGECRQTRAWSVTGESLAPALLAYFRHEVPEAPYVAGFRFIQQQAAKPAANVDDPGHIPLRVALPVIADMLVARH